MPACVQSAINRAVYRQLFVAFQRTAAPYLAAQPEAICLSRAEPETVREFMGRRVGPAFNEGMAALTRIGEYNHRSVVNSVQRIDHAVNAAKTGIWVSFLAALALAALTGFYLLQAVTEPLQRLTRAVKVMAKGDFSERLALARSDEFGVLAQGYDRMSADLSTLVGQILNSGIQVNSSVNELAATLREQQATAT